MQTEPSGTNLFEVAGDLLLQVAVIVGDVQPLLVLRLKRVRGGGWWVEWLVVQVVVVVVVVVRVGRRVRWKRQWRRRRRWFV